MTLRTQRPKLSFCANAGQPEDRTVGTVAFNDGSTYTGTIRNGLPDGLGTCIWKDGNKASVTWTTDEATLIAPFVYPWSSCG